MKLCRLCWKGPLLLFSVVFEPGRFLGLNTVRGTGGLAGDLFGLERNI